MKLLSLAEYGSSFTMANSVWHDWSLHPIRIHHELLLHASVDSTPDWYCNIHSQHMLFLEVCMFKLASAAFVV